MASAADVRDIMGLPAQETAITKDSIINADKKKKEKKKESGVFQRPEGMHRWSAVYSSTTTKTCNLLLHTIYRELYNLLYSENKELPCPLIQVLKEFLFLPLVFQWKHGVLLPLEYKIIFLRRTLTSTKGTNRCVQSWEWERLGGSVLKISSTLWLARMNAEVASFISRCDPGSGWPLQIQQEKMGWFFITGEGVRTKGKTIHLQGDTLTTN